MAPTHIARRVRHLLLLLFVPLGLNPSLLLADINPLLCKNSKALPKADAKTPPPNLPYKVRATYPHSTNAYTQGLVYHQGYIYESTGQYGHSSVSQIDLISGKRLQTQALAKKYFGEGLTIWQKQLIQLTWKSGKVFLYHLNHLKPIINPQVPVLSIEGEGWGITHNGKSLVTSNGSEYLSFRDPETLMVQSTVKITYLGRPLKKLNELEWVNGCVLANIWQSQYIAVINPNTGITEGLIDLKRIIAHEKKLGSAGVANGIALLTGTQRLLVTGKNWRHVYEIDLLTEKPDETQ